MAEAVVVGAVVGFLLENMKQILMHHVHLVQDAEAQVESLENDLRVFRAFLEDSTETSRNNKAMMQVVREIRDIVYEIEDVIDVYVSEAADKKSMGYFRKWFDAPKRLISVAKEVQRIRDQIKTTLNTERIELAIRGVDTAAAAAVSSLQSKAGPKVREDNIVGFEDEAEKVIGYLMEETEGLDAISIIGLPGLGKTTLASKIFRDPKIEFEFPTRIWVYVSQEYQKKDVFLEILSKFGKTQKLKDKNEKFIIQQLHKRLAKGKFLVVMDDVWSGEAWDELKEAFPKTNKTGKIIITSRHKEVAHQANPSRDPHNLRFLTMLESRMLLQLEAFGETRCPQELESFETTIVEKCGGLPLAIVVIGGILVKKSLSADPMAIKEAWREVSECVPTYLREDRHLEEIISLSYSKLPYHLRSCFLYLGMFPEDYEIPVWTLTRMWIAEGFIQPRTDITLEATANDYLKELVNRNLVMVEKVSILGKIKTCRIHDALRQFCKKESGHEEENFFQEMKLSAGGGCEPSITSLEKYRRLCIHSSIVPFISSRDLYGPRIRSFLCSSKEENIRVPADYLSSIPSAFKLLRILYAKPLILTKVPNNITKLVHLRFVVLSSTFTVIPENFSALWNIQTLVVYTSSRKLEIKANIWNMLQLRHVKTNASAILPQTGKSTEELGEKLQTLGAISPESCTEDLFDRARSLRKLCIRGKIVDLKDAKGFDKLDKLEKLKLMNDVSTGASEGKLPCLPQMNTMPPKLRALTLCSTHLEWSHMRTLGMLKTLEVLKLKENAFVGEMWESSPGGFRFLEVLHIERTNLVVWRAEANHFPRLRCLVLRNCEKLQEIPTSLGELESLQQMDLKRVTTPVSISAREIEEVKKRKREEQPTVSNKVKFKLYIAPGDES